MHLHLPHHRDPVPVDAAPFPDAWRPIIEANFAPWARLDARERSLVESDVVEMVEGRRWEAARGFELTDEVRVTIAAHASLLVLNLPAGLGCYSSVSSIIVHASVMERPETRSFVRGPIGGTPAVSLIGEAVWSGPVLLSWDVSLAQCRHPDAGENVILHEFAHRLDMLDGAGWEGSRFADPADREKWIAIGTRAYQQVKDGDESALILRNYAGTNTAEFFAVATEVFFTKGRQLSEAMPDLFDLLVAFYRQDPRRYHGG